MFLFSSLRKLTRIYFKNLRKPCEPKATFRTDVPESSNENSIKILVPSRRKLKENNFISTAIPSDMDD